MLKYNEIPEISASSHTTNVLLYRMKYLCSKLGNPQKKVKKPIVVTGTNGKGSTCRFLTAILSQKYRVGMLTSPHLDNHRERISINGEPISEEDFAKYYNRVIRKAEALKSEGMSNPTDTEIVTLMAFLYFIDNDTDYNVLEVGIGGLVDCVNVIEHRVLSIITNIDYEHALSIGPGMFGITSHKLAVITENTPVVTGCSDDSTLLSMRETCWYLKSPLYVLNQDFPHYNGRLSLHGDYQKDNAAIAIKAAEILEPGISLNDVLKDVTNPGRMETWNYKNYDILLDGAHNVHAIRALTKELKSSPHIFVFTVTRYRDIYRMLRELLNPMDTLVLVQLDNVSVAAYDTNNFRKQNLIFSDYFVTRVDDALDVACKRNQLYYGNEAEIVVCGSLYLVKKIRDILIKNGAYYIR